MIFTYKKAGVNVQKIKKSQNEIGRIIASTHNLQKNIKVKHGFGHYAGIVNVADNITLAMHTDGVGTKVLLANMMKKYDTIGIDCVAMNVNDIICTGATPISFVDYIAANKNDKKIFVQIAKGLAKGAKLAQTPIVGGETAIMPDLFAGKGFSFDLSGMVVGMLPKRKLVLGNSIAKGDVILGIKSSGLHSNGYSLARKVLLSKYSIKDKIKGVGRLGDVLLTPTQIYVKPVLEIIKKCKIHGLAHITGGSFTKLLRLKKIGYNLDSLPEPPPVMQLIEKLGVKNHEMYKTFNMGVGFCVIAPKSEAVNIESIITKHKMSCQQIGNIVDKTGVFVNSTRIS